MVPSLFSHQFDDVVSLIITNFVVFTFYHEDYQAYSPELKQEEIDEAEDNAGSFSPELLHGDETEEAIDPEEDKAMLVTFVSKRILIY